MSQSLSEYTRFTWPKPFTKPRTAQWETMCASAEWNTHATSWPRARCRSSRLPWRQVSVIRVILRTPSSAVRECRLPSIESQCVDARRRLQILVHHHSNDTLGGHTAEISSHNSRKSLIVRAQLSCSTRAQKTLKHPFDVFVRALL